MWWTWHDSVPTIGFTCSDHRHPGSKIVWPRASSPSSTISMRAFSTSRRMSGLSKRLRRGCTERCYDASSENALVVSRICKSVDVDRWDTPVKAGPQPAAMKDDSAAARAATGDQAAFTMLVATYHPDMLRLAGGSSATQTWHEMQCRPPGNVLGPASLVSEITIEFVPGCFQSPRMRHARSFVRGARPRPCGRPVASGGTGRRCRCPGLRMPSAASHRKTGSCSTEVRPRLQLGRAGGPAGAEPGGCAGPPEEADRSPARGVD